MEQTLNLNQMVALFLAEAIRSRRMSISRAAEISQRVVSNLPRVSSENEVLNMLTDISRDFDEVVVLKQALHFGHHPSDVKIFESEIKYYASEILENDIDASNAFLQYAAQPGMTIQQLFLKYPTFCQFLMSHPDKAEVLQSLRVS